ncbi:folate-binding protein YgfZ [Maritimibacter sp. 55A14]|uniref:CAF17-like 4Fe-4S cluster assembly/insertion protein YgfZ n=1 Tax=Maritimibacter sp. 55A14 TaxID=2174844 RepID=UPI000D616778|nr:folate-binding protein YgfZ [Maritimibacter sp. 55A14]PWE32013.1 folate-binding protein YgfZ [Maritimibacter sp. 55A14]
MTATGDSGRSILEITGDDRVAFLQGLVTNDLSRLAEGPVYAALLTPQGKYLADFFLVADGDRVLLDTAAGLAPDLLRRLGLYRLRADVAIAKTGLTVTRGLGGRPAGAVAVADPRHPALGWRAYTAPEAAPEAAPQDWDAIRVTHCIPEYPQELQPGESFILEAGFERLHGVDHRKGCYVGQEVTARMKHKTELRKGFATVTVEGEAEPGTEITADGKPVGRLCTRSRGQAIAYLRFDRAGPDMRAGGARVGWQGG